MTFSRYLLGSLVALGAALLAHTATWVTVKAATVELTIDVSGATADPVGVALGTVVGVAAVVAAWNRAIMRRILLALAALAALGMAISAAVTAADFSSAAVAAVAEKTGVLRDGHGTQGTLWPWFAVVASLAAGALLTAAQWAGAPPERTPRTGTVDDEPWDSRSAWKQLSSGVDPTASG